MADTQSKFIKRVVSGVIAAAAVLGISAIGAEHGKEFLCVVATVLSLREFARMAFSQWDMPKIITWLYWAVGLLMFAGLILRFQYASVWFSLAIVSFTTGTLWLCHSRASNEQI